MSIVVPNFAQIGGFLYYGGHFGFKMATITNQNGCNMVQHVLLPVNIHFHWNLLIFEILTIFLIFILFFQPPKAATHYSGYSYKVSWSLMKGIPNFFKSPIICFHGNCGKVFPTDSNLFGLSRSTRCGCCSYQVSSISVWRVTCYDHFGVFHIFSILAVSMATAAILEKSTLKSTTSHGIWYSYKVS